MAKETKPTTTLASKVWKMADVLSSAGIAFTDYITQLTYIIFYFLKLMMKKHKLLAMIAPYPKAQGGKTY